MTSSSWSDPILTCADAKALEARLFGGDEECEWAAMQRAGAAVARAVLEDYREIGGFPDGGRVLVLAGKGHNGGDALVAAAMILEKYPTASADVVFAFGERTLRPVAARAWRELAGGTGLPTRVQRIFTGREPRATAYDLCVDGIFGFQFHPPVDAAADGLLRSVNANPNIRLRAAVDLPSGVGEKAGEVTFHADFTYATGSVKAPLLAPANREAAGRVRYLDLGFFEPVERAVPNALGRVLKASVLSPLGGLRPPQTDKRHFGHLFVIGGSRSYPGAVLMCTQAALRSGAGRVTAFVPESLTSAFAACAPEAIWVGWPETPQGGLALEGLPVLRARLAQATALVMGCGLGPERETLALVEEIVKAADVPFVLDADALQPAVLACARGKPVICLPHAGEFQRLTGGTAADAPALRAAARETGATIVLKGSITRIAGSDQIFHSCFGGPVLARGGSGDLLAGLAGGLLAQTATERSEASPVGAAAADLLLAACRGVVWHGLAADLLARDRGQVAVRTTQLLDYLPAALRGAGR